MVCSEVLPTILIRIRMFIYRSVAQEWSLRMSKKIPRRRCIRDEYEAHGGDRMRWRQVRRGIVVLLGVIWITIIAMGTSVMAIFVLAQTVLPEQQQLTLPIIQKAIGNAFNGQQQSVATPEVLPVMATESEQPILSTEQIASIKSGISSTEQKQLLEVLLGTFSMEQAVQWSRVFEQGLTWSELVALSERLRADLTQQQYEHVIRTLCAAAIRTQYAP
jgi:hypothetical protein